MNYLGHAFLSFGDPEILTGNMIGDHVKGKNVLEDFPPRIRMGIELHRKIDAFTDSHPALNRAKVWFRNDYHLYAGAILDALFDHFLANDPRYFSSENELLQFTLSTYNQLEGQMEHFPAGFENYFSHMQQHNWLYNYRTLQGIKKALGGLGRRAEHIESIDKAYAIFIGHYYQLTQCYYEFMDDVVKYVKLELNQNPLK